MDLGIGLIIPCFQAVGIIPFTKHLLKSACSVLSRLSHLKTSAGSSSIPIVLLLLRFRIAAFISSMLISLSKKIIIALLYWYVRNICTVVASSI